MSKARFSILSDDNIPFAKEAFSEFGEVRTMPGPAMTNSDIKACDILLVRSTIKVDEKLLAGSKVRFVGTATIGTDHVDEAFLKSKGIRFASAPGSNALSVAEYVMGAILELITARIVTPPDVKVAVIGVGNVGSRVVKKVEALGFKPVLNDPPLKDKTGDSQFRPLDEILPLADIVAVHVPLAKSGPYPTYQMVNQEFIEKMKPGAVFLNASRGNVVNESVLCKALDSRRISAAVLDVWAGEPSVALPTLAHAFIGTPHIAGHSFDGKVRGTEMLYNAVCDLLGTKPKWKMEQALPPPYIPEVVVPKGDDPYDAALKVVRTIYDVREDDAHLRALNLIAEPHRAGYFDYLRRYYPPRREFPNTRVIGDASDPATKMLADAGFKL